MTERGLPRMTYSRVYKPTGVVLIILAAVLAIMFFVVRNNLDRLTENSSNSVQWSLTQVESDYFRMLDAVHHAIASLRPEVIEPAHHREALNEIRTAYDQLHQRLLALNRNVGVEPLRDIAALDELTARIEKLGVFLNEDNGAFASSLDPLLEELHALDSDVHRAVILGTRAIVEQTEQRQSHIAISLQQIGLLVFAAFVLMGLAIAYAFRSAILSQRQGRELSDTSARLSAIVNNSLDAIIVADRDGRFVEFNAAAEEVFGFSRSEVIGELMGDVIVPDHFRDAHNKGMKRYRVSGQSRIVNGGRIEVQAQRRDGSIIPIEMAVQRDLDAEDEVFIAFIRDISARLKAEEDLLTARDEALSSEKAKSDFLAVMSHEMRTPLNGLLGTLDLMKSENLSSKEAEYLRIMEISSKQLLMHVDDVLDISRLDADDAAFASETFDLGLLIRDTTSSLTASAEKRGIVFDLNDVPATLPTLGNAARVNQILLNLLGNAIKFTEDGTVSVTAERTDDETVRLHIRDTGIGIEPGKIDSLFDDFVRIDAGYTRDTQGVGLGLAIVRRIVDRIGGSIDIESAPGEGTLVKLMLRLPNVIETAKDAAVASDGPVNVAGRKKVLVVEDNDINRLILCRMLDELGHQVDEAADGADGVAKAGSNAYDLIFMDISMPTMDGLTATGLIRSQDGPCRDVPIIAATANALATDKEKFEAAGLNDYLFKPISTEALKALFARLSFDDYETAPAQVSGPQSHNQLIDEEVIYAAEELLGKADLSRILAKFIGDGDALIALLRDVSFAEEHDRTSLARSVHKMLGSAQMVGTTGFAEALARTEMRLNDRHCEDLTLDAVQDLRHIWLQTKALIQETWVST